MHSSLSNLWLILTPIFFLMILLYVVLKGSVSELIHTLLLLIKLLTLIIFTITMFIPQLPSILITMIKFVVVVYLLLLWILILLLLLLLVLLLSLINWWCMQWWSFKSLSKYYSRSFSITSITCYHKLLSFGHPISFWWLRDKLFSI